MIKVSSLFIKHFRATTSIAKHNTKSNANWSKAIDRAVELISNQLVLDYDPQSEVLRIEGSRGWNYVVSEGHCSCPASVRHCKHRAARKLIQRTLESMEQQSKLEMDELFPD